MEGVLVVGGPNCGGDPMVMGDPFWGCIHWVSMGGGNQGEEEFYMKGLGVGGTHLGVAPV